MRALVVHPDLAVVEKITRLLYEGGAEVEYASSVRAWRLRAASTIDCCVLDGDLMRNDGATLLSEIRSVEGRAAIVALVRSQQRRRRREAFREGASAVLGNAFRAGEFVRCLSRLLGAAAGDVLVFAGGMVLDRAERTATVDDAEVELTPHEIAILANLMRHRDVGVAREVLRLRVWPMHSVQETTVDANICRLRKKLGRAGRMIETVPGGYRFRSSWRAGYA